MSELQKIIKHLHGCDSKYIESVAVTEVFHGKVAWDGVVEVFDLTGHPRAKRCYAWQYVDGPETKTVAVLEIPPVDSPQSAVKVAVAAHARKTVSKN